MLAARSILMLSAALAAAACGAGRAPSPASSPAPPPTTAAPIAGPGALARFAALKVMVLPTQSARAVDSVAWRTMGGALAVRAAVDSAVELALGARGLSALWVFPPALARAARRNPTYLTDPSAIPALGAVRAALRKPDDPLTEPFASQLRALAGVSDARYAFVPLDVRRETTADGGAPRLVLQAAVVDARGSRVVWVGDVWGDAVAAGDASARAAIAALALRIADLVVPR